MSGLREEDFKVKGVEESIKQFNEDYQKYVSEKHPDYKENLEKQVTELNIDPLQKGESIEERRINNLQKVGVNPYAPHVIIHFSGVSKHKSVWRAMRRGHVSVNGELFPNKPFNNRANSSERVGIHSRTVNEAKKNIYNEYRKIADRI